jgi:pimeloyl-ACP methyl ester carboxylesterase
MKKFLPLLLLLFACHSNRAPQAPQPRIHYTVTGSGKTAIVFIHGWCINGTYWDKQVNFLKDKYKIVTLDLQGHGQSPASEKELSIEKHANDVAALIRYLQLNRVILVGHSMSGTIMLRVYRQMPGAITGLIGIDNLQQAGFEPSPEEAANIKAFFEMFRKNYRDYVKAYALQYLFHAKTDTLVKQRVINDMTSANPETALATLESLASEYKSEQAILPTLKIPLLLIVQEGSIKDESLLKKYCGSGYKIWGIKDCGHYPMIEQPNAFNALLREAVEFAEK